jgi:hypothetical protein
MRKGSSLWALAAVLAASLGALCACGPRATRAAQGSWYTLRTPRFEAWTDGDVEPARALLLDLERFHHVMRAVTSAEERDGAPPLRIFIAKDTASFRALAGVDKQEIVGLFRATTRGNYAFIDMSKVGDEHDEPWQISDRSLLFHEYTHYMMSQSAPRIPSWYNEGFAEYMAATRFREDGRYTVGCVPQHRAAFIHHMEWLPMQKVLAADNVASLLGSRGTRHTGTHVGSDRNPADSYAQSWYAVHYFLADGARNQQLNRYLKVWAEGASPAQAAQQAFGMSVGQLDDALRTYSRQSKFDCVAVAPKQPFALPEVAVVALDSGQAHLRIADLLLATMGATPSALEVLEQAGKLAPNDPNVLAAFVRARCIAADTNDYPDRREAALAEAERYLQQAQQRDATSTEVLVVAGHLHHAKARYAQQANKPYADELAAARKAYRSAIRADETLAEAYAGLGMTYMIEDNGSKEAPVVLDAAAYLLPLNTEVVLALAQIHVARNEPAQAVVALEYVLHWSGSEEQRALARNTLAQLRGAEQKPAPSEGF